MTAKENLSGTDTGRASNSVPEVDPIFSYRTSGGGDIYVYIVQSEIAEFAIMTYDDTSTEFAYSVQTMTGYPHLDAKNLVFNALSSWPVKENPFRELKNDKNAMRRLGEILNEFEGE